MNRRRIVVVNQYFPPDTSATSRVVSDFVDVCARRGVPVTVICGHPSYEPEIRPSWRPVRWMRRHGVTKIVVGCTGFDRTSKLGRTVNYVTFMLGAGLLIPFVVARSAFVVLTDPPMAPLLAWWALRTGRVASTTIWIQDLHPDFGVAAGLLQDRRVVRLWRAALRLTLRLCDHVIVLGRDMNLRVKAITDVTTTVVHNGWSGVSRVRVRPEDDGAQPLRIMHFGNLGFAGPWTAVLSAAREVVDVAEFVFVGGGVNERQFLSETPSNVRLVPRVPHDQISSLAANADVLLVGVRSGLEGYVVPSKGYEMMALGRPLFVVSAPGSEMRLLVEEHGCGFVADDDAEAIATAIRAVAQRRADFSEMSDRAATAAVNYSRALQFGSLIDVLSPA